MQRRFTSPLWARASGFLSKLPDFTLSPGRSGLPRPAPPPPADPSATPLWPSSPLGRSSREVCQSPPEGRSPPGAIPRTEAPVRSAGWRGRSSGATAWETSWSRLLPESVTRCWHWSSGPLWPGSAEGGGPGRLWGHSQRSRDVLLQSRAAV